MARAISNRNMCDARFEAAQFDGPWLAAIGKPELRGAWIIFGESGSGKTHFALQLLGYLTKFADKVAYDTIEQGISLSFQTSWNDAEMGQYGNKVIILDKEQIPELRERLRKRKSPQIIVIDSITALVGFTRSTFAALLDEFPNKLFIFIAHEEGGKPYPAVAKHVRKLSEVKMRVEGFKAFTTTRYANDKGGGADYTIWPEGAAKYYAEITKEDEAKGDAKTENTNENKNDE